MVLVPRASDETDTSVQMGFNDLKYVDFKNTDLSMFHVSQVQLFSLII